MLSANANNPNKSKILLFVRSHPTKTVLDLQVSQTKRPDPMLINFFPCSTQLSIEFRSWINLNWKTFLSNFWPVKIFIFYLSNQSFNFIFHTVIRINETLFEQYELRFYMHGPKTGGVEIQVRLHVLCRTDWICTMYLQKPQNFHSES